MRPSDPRLLLVVATVSALAVVPDWPFRHAGDPSYWGVTGYLVAFVLLAIRQPPAVALRPSSRRLLRAFLVGLPLVYVANRLRFGGTGAELAVELAGLGAWLALAAGAGRSDRALWGGIAAHALWDTLHFGRSAYVPDWYVTACVAVDVGVAAFVLLTLRGPGSAEGSDSAPEPA